MHKRDIKDSDGKSQAKLYLLADLTWEKTIEEKLALSEKLAIYSELMAGIAHQLNNPLVGVVNFSALLLQKLGMEDPNRKLVETISEAAQDFDRLRGDGTRHHRADGRGQLRLGRRRRLVGGRGLFAARRASKRHQPTGGRGGVDPQSGLF